MRDEGVFKAASGLAGGIARRGETCGALLGGIMMICQIVGRAYMEDTGQYQKAMVPSAEMYLRFKEEVGHTLCSEIHKILYGRSFKLYEEDEVKAFREAGGNKRQGCPGILKKAAQLAANIILDLESGSK